MKTGRPGGPQKDAEAVDCGGVGAAGGGGGADARAVRGLQGRAPEQASLPGDDRRWDGERGGNTRLGTFDTAEEAALVCARVRVSAEVSREEEDAEDDDEEGDVVDGARAAS